MITCVSGIWPSYLDWFLDVVALSVLDLLALGLGDILALLPGHLLVLGHRVLAAFLHWAFAYIWSPPPSNTTQSRIRLCVASQEPGDKMIIRTLSCLK